MDQVLVLAFAAALYPALLAAVVLILTQPAPRLKLAAFLLGGMLVSIVAGVAILAALDGAGLDQSSGRTARPAADIVLGVLSLAGAWLLLRRRRHEAAEAPAPAPEDSDKKQGWVDRALGRESLLLLFVVGVALNLPGIWYLAALNEISTGGYSTVQELELVLAFNLIMFALVEIPLVGYFVAPDWTARRVAAFDLWVRGHKLEMGIAIAGAAGFYLVTKGLAEL